MMNGHGKSDRPVVPAKSPNNAEGAPVSDGPLAVAEGVEGRASAHR